MVQDPADVQYARFWPAAASVAKYICPTMQVPGLAAKVPDFTGDVLPAAVKSTKACDPLDRNGPNTTIPPFTVSWPFPTGDSASTANAPITVLWLIPLDFLIIRLRPSLSRYSASHTPPPRMSDGQVAVFRKPRK
jgi:hypothetical protein